MKKYIYILFVAGVLFTCFSCEDYLVENPPSMISFSDITSENIDVITTGVYEPLTRSRGRLWESHYGTALTVLAEYGTCKGGNLRLSNYEFDRTYGWLKNPWSTFYEAIARANILIRKLEDNTSLANEVKMQADGEAKFVRAMVYYNLVRVYGKVPMRLVPVIDSDNTSQPLAEIADIYDQIIKDLLDAESSLPATTSSPGRATAGAAKTALADAYLTMKRYDDARAKAKEVMDNKALYGYDLISSLTDLYSPTSATSAEDIFSIKFSGIDHKGSFLPTYFAPNSSFDGQSWAFLAGISPIGLAQSGISKNAPLIRDWDDNDLRKGLNIYDSIYVDGVKMLPGKYRFDYYIGKYRDPGAPSETSGANDYYLFRYADVLLIFAEAENQLNGATTAAYDAINQVRRRGYGVGVNTPDAQVDLPAGLSTTDFDDLVFRERGYEFMSEGKRWFDLKRTDRFESYVVAAGKPIPIHGLYHRIHPLEILANDAIDE